MSLNSLNCKPFLNPLKLQKLKQNSTFLCILKDPCNIIVTNSDSIKTLKPLPKGKATGNIDLFNEKTEQRNTSPSFEQIKNGAVMKKGQQGEGVKKLQQRLTALGFPVQNTGLFGNTTESVLKKFQKAYGITPTGQLGPTTLNMLERIEKDPYNASLGKKIAKTGQQIASARNTIGQCYNAVAIALESNFGTFLTGLSAYMAADQLAKYPKFKEIKVSPDELPKLRAGSVVVWAKSVYHPHGHISIALGNGQEASDHIEPQITNLSGSSAFRVFIPV